MRDDPTPPPSSQYSPGRNGIELGSFNIAEKKMNIQVEINPRMSNSTSLIKKEEHEEDLKQSLQITPISANLHNHLNM